MSNLSGARHRRTFSGIYQIVNVLTGDCYIGQSMNVGARFWQHLRHLAQRRHANPLLQSSFDQCGPAAFRFEIIESCSPCDLNAREQHHIEDRKPTLNAATAADGVPQQILRRPAIDPTNFLSPRQRQAFRLWRDDGLTQVAIATRLNIRRESVCRLLARASRKVNAVASACTVDVSPN